MSLPREQRPDAIRAALVAALQPTELELVDESHNHAGHVGARDGRGHFALRITSDHFAGLAPLARHRVVHAALGSLMQSDIHALTIVARAPGET